MLPDPTGIAALNRISAPWGVRRTSRGYFLLDAMLATFVGASILLSAVAMIMTGTAAADAARQNNTAYNCARQILENMRLHKGGMIANGSYSDATHFGSVPQLSYLRDGTASVSVSTWRNSPRPVKSVIITVTWRTGKSQSEFKSRVTSALISSKGVGL